MVLSLGKVLDPVKHLLPHGLELAWSTTGTAGQPSKWPDTSRKPVSCGRRSRTRIRCIRVQLIEPNQMNVQQYSGTLKF